VGRRKDEVSSKKITKLLERAEHSGTPTAEAAACREKVKAIRKNSKALVVKEVSPEDLKEADLGELAVIANKFHDEIQAAGESLVVAAWSAGQVLLTVKEQLDHGEWTPWLDANFHGSRRTARDYMQIASKWQRAADLDSMPSIRAALEEITREKPDEPDLSYKPKGKGGKRGKTAGEKFVKRFNCGSDDFSVIIYEAEKDSEYADAAREHLEPPSLHLRCEWRAFRQRPLRRGSVRRIQGR
jgi:hypothetical protein